MQNKTSPAVIWFWIIVGIMLIGGIVGAGDSGETCYRVDSYNAEMCTDNEDGTTTFR